VVSSVITSLLICYATISAGDSFENGSAFDAVADENVVASFILTHDDEGLTLSLLSSFSHGWFQRTCRDVTDKQHLR